MPKKRSNPDHDSPAKSTEKRSKENEDSICPVCDKIIVEGAKGDDAIYCEGVCAAWLHRKCASLSKCAYVKLSNCDDPYVCPNCTIIKQAEEIAKLKKTAETLAAELAGLKNLEQKVAKQADTPQTVIQTNSNSPTYTTVNSNSKPGCISDTIQNATHFRSDHKFNLIVHGIPESNPGTLQLAHIQSNFNSIGSLLSDLKSGILESSIRDCIRLGKYKKDSQYPRPILAKFNHPTDVLNLLSLTTSLPKGVTFKADLSPQEHKIKAILLKERWNITKKG